MAATSRNPTFSTFITIKPHHSSILVLSFLPKSPPTPRRRSLSLQISSTSPKPPSATPIQAPQIPNPRKDPTNTQHFISRFAPDEQRKGSEVLVEALEREGVRHVFAFPGGTILDIHQALTNSNTIRNVLPRHEQGGIFAASGEVGVCIATSGPGATNLVSVLADAMYDSVPLVAITGRPMIGTDAFSEIPIVEITRSITKHNYLVLDVDDIPRIVEEAFFLANSGRPGPVLIDVPKDIQQQLVVPDWGKGMELVGYVSTLPKLPNHEHLKQIVTLINEAKRPVLHVSLCADLRVALLGLIKILESRVKKCKFEFSEGREELGLQKTKFPLGFQTFGGAIPPQYAIQVLDELTSGEAILSTGVGQHQMWAAHKYNKPRQWLTSGGLGAMGFGLPAAMGAAVARPDAVVVDIDGDGSFMMNVQELATIKAENLPVKIMLLNNQHLGMVVQWEDRFYKSNRAQTYLGNPFSTAQNLIEDTPYPSQMKTDTISSHKLPMRCE